MSGVLLTILSVALSVFVLLGVEHVRQETRSGFASTVSGVDLIVGARTGDINLLLLSVLGSATRQPMLHGMQLKRLVKRRGFPGRPYFSG